MEFRSSLPYRQRSLRYCPCYLCCSPAGMIGSDGVCSSNKTQRNIWDQVEQESTERVYCHPRLVQSIKLLDRPMKPSAMESIHPIVCEQEEQPPHEQDAIID